MFGFLPGPSEEHIFLDQLLVRQHLQNHGEVLQKARVLAAAEPLEGSDQLPLLNVRGS